MIYMNHAASSWPKPECVKRAFFSHIDAPPCGQLRSSVSKEAANLFIQEWTGREFMLWCHRSSITAF